MARLTIPDEQTYADFTVVTSTSVFPITYSLFAKADLTVLVDDEALDQADFTFSGTLLEGGGYDGGTVTLNDAVDDVTVRIERNVAPARTSNFAPSSSVPVGSVDIALNRLTAIDQDHKRRLGILEAAVDDTDGTIAAAVSAAAASASAAAGSASTATSNAAATAADRVQTGLDVIASGVARDLAQQYASDAATVSGVNVPIYASKASATGAGIAAAVDRIYVGGYAADSDGGAAYYKRAASNPSRPYTSFQDLSGDWWELDAEQPNSAQYGFDTTADCGPRALAMITENTGKTVRVKKSANGDPYITSRWLLSGTTDVIEIVLENGVVIADMPAPAAASVGWLRVPVGVKCRIWGFGATITQTSRATSSCINSSGCGMLHIFGLTIVGAGGTSVSSGSDCLYLGGNGTTGTSPSSNVHVRWVEFSGAYRNVVSIVEGYNVTIEDFVFSGAQSTPGAGIDFESNRYSTETGRAPMRNIVIRNGICRNNNKNGLCFIFCDDVLVENVICYDNGQNGFVTSAGGANHDEGRAREGKEVSAIEAFATDGWITVPNPYWLNMQVGTVCRFGTRNGATRPAELTTAYHFIYEKDSTGTKIRVSATGTDSITTLTGTGTGTFTSDRWTSDHYLTLYQDGSCGGITLRRCVAYNNGASGVAEAQFLFNQVVGLKLEDCRATQKLNASPFNIAYSRNVTRKRCEATGDPAATTAPAFSCSTSAWVTDEDLTAVNCPGGALATNNIMGYRLNWLRGSNCGSASQTCWTGTNLRRPVIENLRLRGDPGVTWTRPLLTTNVIDAALRDCDFTGIGTSDTNITGGFSSTTRFVNCLGWSGAKIGTGSKTHDFASIAAGAFGTSTTVSVPGAQLGQPARAEMGTYTAGIVMHAVVSAVNTVTVTPQNITAGAIDLASGTLSASIMQGS